MSDPWQAQLGALGAFIRAQRQLADLSLREMAALTRISNAYLSQVERGLHEPSMTVLRAIAEALGLTPAQLLAKAGWTQATAGHPVAEDPADAPAEDPADVAAGSPASTEDSIRGDPQLTEAQREALLGVYRSFIEDRSRQRPG
ncbi:MAG: helix-turn-helix domain-containing protein [Pseudonocardiaceae bacterium]